MTRKKILQVKAKGNDALATLASRNQPIPAKTTTPKSKIRRWNKAQDELLRPILHSHSRPNMLRDDGYTHVSDLLYKCPRMLAMAAQNRTPVMLPPLTESLSLTFKVGEAIHDYIKDKLAVAEPEKLYGIWHCQCGETTYEGTYRVAQSVEDCKHCSGSVRNYGELKLTNTEIEVVGNIDMTLLIDNHFLITEIKSINKKQWDELTRPLPEHLLQVLFYWWLAREAGYNLFDAVCVLYINKDFTFTGSPYKEFILVPSTQIQRLDQYIEDARMLKEAKAGGRLPYRVCPNSAAPQAKKCPLVVPCFHKE